MEAGEDELMAAGDEEAAAADSGMSDADLAAAGDTGVGDASGMGGDDMAGMGADAGIGGDMGMGMPGEEEEKSPSEIGRLYELKKIYSRLTSIEAYLGNESEQELLEIRNHVSQGIALFELVSSNFDSYKDKLNEIIVMYYKFLLEVYKSVKNFYAKEKKSGD